LKQYYNDDNKFKDIYIKTLEEYNEELNILNENYKDLNQIHKELISKKPNEIIDPKITNENHLKEINNIFEIVDNLYNYISENIKEPKLNKIIKKDYTYNDYKNYLAKEIDINTILKLNKEKIIKLENDFKLTFSKQQKL